MKFINYLESITGVGIYPLVSLLIFFVFFVFVGYYILKGRKDHFDMLSRIPLNASTSESITSIKKGNDETAHS